MLVHSCLFYCLAQKYFTLKKGTCYLYPEYWTILFSRSQIRSRSFVKIMSQIQLRTHFFNSSENEPWSRSDHFSIIFRIQIISVANALNLRSATIFPKQFLFCCISFWKIKFCEIFFYKYLFGMIQDFDASVSKNDWKMIWSS